MPKINGTPKVRFNLLDRKAAETYVFAFFHYRGGQRLKYSAGEKVRPIFWDDDHQRLRLDKRHPEHSDINITLNNLEITILQVFRDFNKGEISPADFRKELDYRLGYVPRPETKLEKALPFFEFIENYTS